MRALLWYIVEHLVARVLRVAVEDTQDFIQPARLAQQHQTLVELHRLQITQSSNATMLEKYLHGNQVVSSQPAAQHI